MVDGWIVARTKPNREMWAAENLSRQNFGYYLPRVAEVIRFRDGIKQHLVKPLFRNYIFVWVDENWVPVSYTFGIAGVMMSGTHPAHITDEEIAKIKALEGKDGLVTLPDRYNGFATGETVRIKSGLLAGHRGIYRGMSAESRVHVLLDYLGHKTKVLIGDRDLEHCA